MKPRWAMGTSLPALALAIAAALPAQASTGYTPLDGQGRATYLVTFAEPGLLPEHQQQRGVSAKFVFDENSQEVQQLKDSQEAHLAGIRSALGRGDLSATHRFLVTHSGVAVALSDEEVARLRSLPGIANIQREREYQLDTYRGPTYIGAGGIWDGTSVPGGVGVDGTGMVAAILDTGIQSTHPSFANDASCGFSGASPKVKSSLDCGSTDGSGMCNGANPEDTNGHGSHTASTVAGNRLTGAATPAPNIPAPYTELSGLAPCAAVRSYKVCPGNNCPGAAIAAGLNSALAHGDADAVNFSISGGENPWNDNDRTFLDFVNAGTFVAASAGNNSTADPTVVGKVNHRGPWVMSVAASTRDGNFSAEVLTNGVTYSANLASESPTISVPEKPIRFDASQPSGAQGCTASGGFPTNFFTGSIALIQRGTCPFTEKVSNAVAQGAEAVLIWNNEAAGIIPLTPGQDPDTPVFGINLAAGQAIHAYINSAGAGAVTQVNVIPSQGDVLADFSYRGPTPGNLADLQKPDITGPGVDIYAAVPDGYANISGTSMSGPHIAGAGLLVAQVRPDWTPSEIKSALQMTAHKQGTKENGTTPWDWDDVGHGRAGVDRAVNAGLVLDETFANYLAANPSSGGDVRTLNLAGLRNRNCSPSCTWTRTVRNTLGTASSWTAAGAGITANMNITVSPSSFSFTGDTSETQVLTITAAPVDDLTSTIGFGELVFSETGDQSPDLHFTVAIQGEPAVFDIPQIALDQSQFVFVMNPDDTSNQTLTISNTGTQPLEWEITEAVPAAAPRGGYNPALDEVLTIPNFTVNPTTPHNASVPGGVTNNGHVVGFTFQGTVALVSGDWASDMRMIMSSPDVPPQSFNVGGLTGTINPWAFQGSQSGTSGTYTSTHLGAFDDALSTGNWDFAFTHTYSSGGIMSWSNVTVTLHKMGEPSVCTDPSDITWLSVAPDNGTTASADSTPVSISVDTTGLTAGDYSATVCVASNDPNQGLLEVPVSLTVMDGTIEPAAIEVSETGYNFSLVGGAVGESDSGELIISNTGDLPLSWLIDTAAGTTGNVGQNQGVVSSGPRGSGSQSVLGTLDGSVQVFSNQLAGLVTPNDVSDASLSVDGMTTGGSLDSGDPNNSSQVLPIGVGNQLIGIGWEVNITAQGGSWGTEAAVIFRTNLGDTAGLVLRPAAGDQAGSFDRSSDGIIMLEDVEIPPVAADASGLLRVDWYEAAWPGDAAPDPDSIWADLATSASFPPGLRLICTDQAACDAAVTGTSLPASCASPSEIPWLNVEPAAGLTTGGNDSTVTISVDATGLDGGTYEALLCVGSNAANDPLIEIPVVLEVTAPAQIAVAPAAIAETVAVNTTEVVPGTINNLGGLELNWSIETAEPAGGGSPLLQYADAVGNASFLQGGGAPVVASFDQVSGTPGGLLLRQTNDSNIVPANSVACPTGPNFVYRRFQFADHTEVGGALAISSINVGLQEAASSQPLTVNLYALPSSTPDETIPVASLVLIGSGMVNITSADNGTLLNVPVSAVLTDTAAYDLVVEVTANVFYIGATNTGESRPGYIAAPACGLAEPGPIYAVGPDFVDTHVVIEVNGQNMSGCDSPGTVPWLSVSPLTGSTIAGGSSSFDVTLDATGLGHGTYEAMLCVSSNDPVNPLVEVPVTMTVPLGANDAIIQGTIQSLGYCSADPSVLAGAEILVTGANGSYNATTDASGNYQVTLGADESPVTVAVSATNHNGASQSGVVLVAQDTVTVDLDLELLAPCASATPNALGTTLGPDQVDGESLSLINDGAADYTWSIDFEEGISAFPRGTENVVADGGFELGEPNPEWDESSSTFGTVLCTIADCGTGTGTGPHGGNWWVWFGGVAAGDTGHASQDVTLPVGSSATLRFYLEMPVATQPGYVRVSLGGNQIFEATQADAGSYATYQLVEVDVSSYADGGTYELRFDSVTTSSAGTTNFFVDDVSLLVQPGPLDCADPQGVAWLVVDGADAGTVAAHSSETVDVLYDSTGLTHGQYQANLCLETSDTQNALIVIPVTLDVVEDGIFEDGFEDTGVPRGTYTGPERRMN